MADRLKRLCDVCGQLDDHPRHVQAVAPGTDGAVPTTDFLTNLPDGMPALAVAELMDPTTVVRHHDCCASRGCGVCQGILAQTGNKTGNALLKSLQQLKPSDDTTAEVLAAAPDDEEK